MLVQWHDIHLAFPDKHVLRGVSLTVHQGDRIGLVGENGAGKTCLFRILLGEVAPTAGTVYRANGVRIGYLTQSLLDTDAAAAGRTCWDCAAEPFHDLMALEQELARYAAALTTADAGSAGMLLARLGEAQERFERLGGYTFRARIEATLTGLGLPPAVWALPVARLSAGQKVRLALARVLLAEYDLLLLDEPTNHLDIAARAWLQQHLRSHGAAYVVVSHDRAFLDAVADKIAYLDRGSLTLYPGNYTAFRKRLAEQTAQAWAVYEKRQSLVRKLESQVQAYRAWSHRAEHGKIGARDKGFVGHRAAKLMRRALHAQQRLEQTIEAMKAEKPFVKDPVTITFRGAEAKRLLRAEDLVAGYAPDRPLTPPVSLTLGSGDRVAVVGPNGCGKSTLLRTLLGELPPLQGRIWRSPACAPGYFDQEARSVADYPTALAAVRAVEPDETLARTVMGRMRIRRESVLKPVSSLSAGERAKVLLARLILGGHNLLVLDEPTNHLDMETQDVLLEALDPFPGAILFVSHDRHFVATLATEVIALETV